MPPRSAKKSSGGSTGKKPVTRTARGTPKTSQPDLSSQEIEKVEDVSISVETKEQIKVAKVIEEKIKEHPSEREASVEILVKEQENMKESFQEDDKGERLDLEDNEPEYEPEEDQGVDYDDKNVEMIDDQEEVDEEEIGEGDIGEEQEGDETVGEMEGEYGEYEGEENVEEEEENGEHVDEEEDEHHEVAKERRKRKEFEVFVGGLDKDATEDDLRKVFSEVGEVTEVRLMMNPLTKKNKGFAFLRFATVEQAKRAVTELKNPVVNGKQCGVTPSQDNDTLFVGNICKTWTKEALKEKLKQHGIDNTEDLTLIEDSNNEGMNRGFAFLEFSSRSDAMEAFKRLQRRDVVFGVDRPAKVAFADSFVEPDDEVMAQVKTVFVDGIPPTWDEDQIRNQLKKFGEVEKVELARNMSSAKRKDFGFVTFDTHDAAVTCAEGINNSEIGEGDTKVKVRARLSRPHQRGRGSRYSRGDFRMGRGFPRGRGFWGPSSHRYPGRGLGGFGGRSSFVGERGYSRPLGLRGRRPVMPVSERSRRLPPPERFYDRRPPVSAYPKSSLKRDYGRRDEFSPRDISSIDYASRAGAERRSSYGDEYPSRGSSYSDVSRAIPRTSSRRSYVDDSYGRRLERPVSGYRDSRAHDYDSLSGSKRPYSALDDGTHYSDATARQSRSRLDYAVDPIPPYEDSYSERLRRSHLGYSSRSSISGQESHGLYSSRQSMGYGGSSVSGSDVGAYSSSFGNDYLSRGTDVSGSSYSSLYSSRGLGGSSYLGGSGSGSYY